MPTALQLRETRAGVWDEMEKILQDHPDPATRPAEVVATWERLDARYDELDDEVARQEKHEKRGASLDGPVDRSRVVADADRRWTAADDEAYKAAFTEFLRSQGGLNDLSPDRAALMRQNFTQPKAAAGVGTQAGGGYLVPPEFRDIIVEQLKFFGPMLNEAEVITTESGATLPWPTNDDTANVGAILGENTQVTEQDVSFGTANIDAYMYTSKLIRASFQLLQDRPDVDTWLMRKLGERIGRIWNMHFTTGTGTAQPDGIVTSATVGATGTGSFATTGGIGYTNLVDIEESIDPAYGGLAGLKYMGHQSMRKALRKMVDTQGRPLWQPSLQDGIAATLNGYEFVVNNDMPTLATSSKSLLFGSIRSAYVIRMVRDVNMLRLNERYADFLQVGFLGYARADGTMQNASAVRVFQTTVTA